MTDRTQPARWYMVDKDGMATLCTDREDAEQEAKDANMAWPHTAPHRAVQLVEASFDSADMATASAQGFRDGVASLAANAGSEPVAWKHDCAALLANDVELWIDACPHCGKPRMHAAQAAHPSPPEGMVGKWMPMETAPKDGTAILLGSRGGSWIGKWLPVYVSGYRPENPWSSLMLNHDHMGEKRFKPTHWMPLPPPPTTTAGSGKGE